jgi:RNA polymerase sigma-70 factor (ECF subfamily)
MPTDLTPSEMQHLTREVREGCLTGLLCCLSFNQRCAFILHVLVGLSVKEAAEVLEKSEPAIKVLIHRARENLKKFLCRNCSLYDPRNGCRCQNLIRFSLKQGWIQKSSSDKPENDDFRQIEQEIQTVRDVVKLYQTLAGSEPIEGLAHRIQKLIENEGLLIFLSPK